MSRDPLPRRLDWPGAGLSAGAMTAVVFTVIEAPRRGWLSAATLLGAVLALLLIAAFVWWQRRAEQPMLDLRLFRDRVLSAACLTISAAFFGLLGFIFLATQYLQLVLGYGTLRAGAAILPIAAAIGVSSGVAPALAARFGARAVLTGGLTLMTVGFALAAATLAADSSFLTVGTVLVLVGSGVGLCTAPATELIVARVPQSSAGVGSAINDTVRELGGAVGVAVLGSVFSSLYSSRIGTALAGAADGAVQRAALDSYGAAVQAAGPSADVSPVLTAAREAFLSGLTTAALVAAGTTASVAVVVLAALREGAPTRRGPDSPDRPHAPTGPAPDLPTVASVRPIQEQP